ncbi:MAG: RibD family protein [SAR324 cluster bacterium]|jgi:diaminohydroxyphosphoribosylaminopyrimidine deaminase/5-amino-6-(5-phosphoribosylamino)uracil reductase|nr:RibD family protein [SAR324 cluster bacterium]HCP34779.1 deaminase [Deltaproteobacteria bacterium]
MKNHTTGIHVTLKAAISLDGKIACAGGDSKWITGEAARLESHRLRHENDAILVGINTVLEDDPSLTVRGIPGGVSPIRVILDSQGKLPSKSKVLAEDGVRVIHVTGNQTVSSLSKPHHHLEKLQAPVPRPEIPWILDRLQHFGIQNLLVEGGSEVHASFIKSRYVSRLHLFIAPKIIGGQAAPSWCAELGISKIADASLWRTLSISPIGPDFHLIAEPAESS